MIGAVVNVTAVAVDPQIPPLLENEQLLDPKLAQDWPIPMLELLRVAVRGETDLNFGRMIGLNGLATLAPLAVLWIAGIFILLWARLRPRPA
jgi:hypothetical protein